MVNCFLVCHRLQLILATIKDILRVCLKRDDSRRVEAIHLGYEKEQNVSNRSDRPSVGLYQRTDPPCKARRATAHAGHASGHPWHLVRRREWLSMADVASRVSGLAKCVHLLPAVA